MKHVMYVFSGTGNTLHIANLVRDSIVGDEIIIQSINDHTCEGGVEAVTADLIGIYFPCYYGSIPPSVRSFVSHMKISKEAYVYSVATAAGSTGYGNKEICKLLAENGIKLSFGRDIQYASNNMAAWYYKMIFRTPEQVKSKLDKFIEGTQKIAKSIANREKNFIKGSFLGYYAPRLITPTYLVKDSRPHDREFTIGDKCNNCGLCVKVCPVENIRIKDGQHYFNHNCQRCLACIQYCPKQAFLIKNKAMNKKRYVNPFVPVEEVIKFHQNKVN